MYIFSVEILIEIYYLKIFSLFCDFCFHVLDNIIYADMFFTSYSLIYLFVACPFCVISYKLLKWREVKVTELCPTLQSHGLYSPWNSLGQNTEVGSLSLLQWIFPTQESNLVGSPALQVDSLPTDLWGKLIASYCLTPHRYDLLPYYLLWVFIVLALMSNSKIHFELMFFAVWEKHLRLRIQGGVTVIAGHSLFSLPETLLLSPLKLQSSLSVQADLPTGEGTSPGLRTLSTFPPCGKCPIPILLFFFCPTQWHRGFLAILEVWGHMPTISKMFCANSPTFWCICGRQWAPPPTPPPASWPSLKKTQSWGLPWWSSG